MAYDWHTWRACDRCGVVRYCQPDTPCRHCNGVYNRRVAWRTMLAPRKYIGRQCEPLTLETADGLPVCVDGRDHAMSRVPGARIAEA